MSDKTEPWKWGDENQPKPEEAPHILGKRHLCCGMDAEMRPFAQGDWVAYNDYKKVEDSLRHYIEQEALRKAGEAMQKPSRDTLEFVHTLDSLAIKKQKEVIETLQAQCDFYKKKLENETDYLVKVGLIDQVTHLKAEVDALKLGSLLTAVDVLQFINLKAENERLRKAGDWMREAIEEGPIDYQCRIDRWNAAKEGKPSV